MTIQELISDYGSRYRIAKDLGFAYNAVRYWERVGYIPYEAQARIVEQTGDKYKITTAG